MLVFGSEAQADVMGSGALFDKNQAEASCTVVNLSSVAVNLSEVRIVSSDGSPVSVPFKNCGVLPPDRSCNVNANMLGTSTTYFCKVETGDASAARLRGTMMIYDSSLKIVGSSDLR